ncbi:MAG: DMT family transporter, partial [Verrucomicrobiaceae bacterium]
MRPETATLIFPLIAALIYVCSALMVKRASASGIGVWRTAFVLNWVMAGLFSFLWLGGGSFHMNLLWQPFVVAVLFVFGQVLQLLALDRGDVSVAVPLFGLKVLLVPLCTTLFLHEPVHRNLWVAAMLSMLGLTLLNRKDQGRPPRNIGITLFGGGFGALSFALVDVLVKEWSPAWGVGRFLPLVIGMGAILSFALMPFFKAPLRSIPRPVWRWLIPGALLMGVQSIIF